jgi:tRNA A-37 threonylcarbamoyl transferase component Bud32
MRSVLLDRLGLPQTMQIESLLDNPGSFNDGVWMVFDGFTTGLVLKLVPHCRSHPSRATDAEKFITLQRRCPKLVTEFSLAFPLRIFQLKSPRGTRSKDLIVMRRASGLQITQHLYHKFHAGHHNLLLQMFAEFGTFLAVMHRVYKGMQHGDCQPSNVFYDEISGNFTLIDVADFGYGPFVAEGGENDVEHFCDGMKTLTQWYGENFTEDILRSFRNGYQEEQLNRRR